jgi:hypothetical protein
MSQTRRIPEPGYAGDAGTANPALAQALASYAASPGDPDRHLEVLHALRTARVLVPVVAVLGDAAEGDDGLTREKTSDMATVLLTGRDGRQALLAFTGLESLAAWRPDARPVPVSAADAARSTVQEGAAALVVDVAGPTSYAVEGAMLDALARGWAVTRTPDGPAWLQVVEDGNEE